MRKVDIMRRIPVSELNIPELEKWLDQLAREGLFLEEALGNGWYFYRAEPKEVRYRMDGYDGSGEEPDAQKREDYQALGWKYVTTHSKMYRIYMSEDPSAEELHTDGIVESLSLRRLQKYFRNEMVLGLIFIISHFIRPDRNDVLDIFSYPHLFLANLEGIEIKNVLFMIWWLGFMVLTCYHFREIRRLRKWMELKKDSDLIETSPHIGTDPRIVRRLVYAWFIVLILGVRVFKAEKMPLDEILLSGRRLPVLEAVETGEMLPVDKTVLEYTNNSYRRRKAIFTIDNYEIHEKRAIRNPETEEIYGASVDAYYYDVREAFFAEPLFDELLRRYAGDGRENLKALSGFGGEFDTCLYGMSGEHQILALKKGSRMMLLDYKGTEDLREKKEVIAAAMEPERTLGE